MDESRQAQTWKRESKKKVQECTDEASDKALDKCEESSNEGESRRQSAEIWIPPKYTSKECEFGNDKQNEKTDSHRNYRDVSTTRPEDSRTGVLYVRETVLKEQVINLYENLKIFLTSDDFGEDLRNELQESNPNYLDVLEKRIKDMEKCDHGIVIAGETSSGKTTLINKILEKRILKPKLRESSSTIVKLRNLHTVRIVTERMSGEKEERDLTNKCDTDTEEGVKRMNDILKKLTDVESKESMVYRSVDVGFPIPFLKGNTILVDTPGIGANKEITQKLKEYLPNAVSFVFVINVANAGGMQKDRLPQILRSIILLKMDNEMPCFDPADVLFITNKWDSVSKKNTNDDSSDEDEDEEMDTWTRLKSDIRQCWRPVKEENIYKLSLKEVSPQKCNESTKQFQKFREALEGNIKKAQNIRKVHHLSFLREILKNISRGLRARLDLNKMSEEEQSALAAAQKDKIKTLSQDCVEAKKSLMAKTNKFIEDTAKDCYDYMCTEEGKQTILNRKGLSMLSWNPALYSQHVNACISLFLNDFLQSEEISNKFHDIRKEAGSIYRKICLQLIKMENDWTDGAVDNPAELDEMTNGANVCGDEDRIPTSTIVGVAFATSPIWIPLLAAGLAICVGAVGITIAISPVLLPAMIFLNRDERKKKIIDAEYENYKASAQRLVRNQLKSTHGVVLEKLIDKLIVDLLSRRMDTLNKMGQQLLELRQEILANRDVLVSLAVQVESLEEEATNLQKCLKEEMMVREEC